jgi:hypothetical protein
MRTGAADAGMRTPTQNSNTAAIDRCTVRDDTVIRGVGQGFIPGMKGWRHHKLRLPFPVYRRASYGAGENSYRLGGSSCASGRNSYVSGRASYGHRHLSYWQKPAEMAVFTQNGAVSG